MAHSRHTEATEPWKPKSEWEHIGIGLALMVQASSREEMAMRLYRMADDIATSGILWRSTLECARELTKAGYKR